MKKPTRREFLKDTVLGAIGTGMALSTFTSKSALAEPQPTGERRSYAAGRYAIFLDGEMAGWLQSVEGGQAAGDAIAGKLGQYPVEAKHIAGVKYEDIRLSCGTGMSPHFYEWIKAATDSQYERRNGQIVTCDENFKAMSALDFSNAIITEVGFPALDAASKDAAKMTIKIRPEWTRINVRPGGSVSGMINTKAQKKWLPANFRLQIAGLDCTRVNKIEAITVKQKVVENPVGTSRGYQKGAANVEVSKLVFTLPEAQAESFYKEAVGKRGPGNGKTGQLDYLSEDMRESLFTLKFTDLVVVSLTSDKTGAGNEAIRRVKVEMYSERMQFTVGKPWA